MRSLATVTFIYNHEPFIIPHFNMISSVDKNFVFIGEKPLRGYDDEHGTSLVPDSSERLIVENFPHVEIFKHSYDGYFCSDLYNNVAHVFKDYDMVLRLDPDMLFMDKDWDRFTTFIRDTDYDCIQMSYGKCSINYYMDWDHGLKDAKEFDIVAFNPKTPLTGILDYAAEKPYCIEWDDFIMHHFRGWNKPKSITKDWPYTEYAKMAFLNHSDNGDWFHCPEEIKAKFDDKTADLWLSKLKT